MIDDGHRDCRVHEFARWSRVMLEHERTHLSKVMTGVAFMQPEEAAGLLHDITDIDYILSQLDKRIKV